MQRLVQKEKQVLQLQSELDRLKAQNPADTREIVSLDSIYNTTCSPKIFRMTAQDENVIG